MKPASILFGPEVIQRLLPHRRPFLMVDTVQGYARSPRPSLEAARQISASEAVLEGHLPGRYLWPSVYVIEGLSQSSGLLQVIWTLQEEWAARGDDPEDVIAALRGLDLGYRLHPGARPEAWARLTQALADGAASRVGLTVAVKIELLEPVSAGERLDYAVSRTELLADLARFEVEALVSGRPVARGTLDQRRARAAKDDPR